jgi:signal transduction histidine kinase
MESKIFTYLFCGLLLMMILFSLASFFQGANKEFLYYSAYAFFLGAMLFIKAIHSYHTTWFAFFQETYLDFIMQSAGHFMYMLFMQKFLATKQNHPFLHKLYNAGFVLLIISMAAFSYAHYFTNSFTLENSIENLTKILLLVMVVIFLVYSFRSWDDRLLRYLFWGNFFLFLFSTSSLLMLNLNLIPSQLPSIFRSSLFYYELGLLIELIFFLLGLNHKNKRQLIAQARERERLKAKDRMNEYEKEIAIYKAQQQERERISADMHDELGSGMTAIRLMSEIARNKMKESTPVEIEKISHSADEVLNKMNAIIWSMNSGNDTIDNLVSYIRSYALEYFENTPIICKISTPDQIEATELSGDKRRNIFLSIKETLNNVLKHSKADEVQISFMINEELNIKIKDNGVGIDLQKVRQFGNGLKNIAKRIESIGGTYLIENRDGTVSEFRLPL